MESNKNPNQFLMKFFLIWDLSTVNEVTRLRLLSLVQLVKSRSRRSIGTIVSGLDSKWEKFRYLSYNRGPSRYLISYGSSSTSGRFLLKLGLFFTVNSVRLISMYFRMSISLATWIGLGASDLFKVTHKSISPPLLDHQTTRTTQLESTILDIRLVY